MTDTNGPQAPPVDVALPTTGETWLLKEVVYTHYTYDDTKPKGEKVIATIRSYGVAETDVDRFAQARVKRLPLPSSTRTYQRHCDDQKPDRAINIYVTDPCWVVIELDRDIDWHFAPNRPAITTKADYGNDNCDLVHVMPDGTSSGPQGPTAAGCRLIYFVVQRRLTDMEHQQFRCHVIHGKSPLNQPDQIDPDIPNDGGRFPFPMVGD